MMGSSVTAEGPQALPLHRAATNTDVARARVAAGTHEAYGINTRGARAYSQPRRGVARLQQRPRRAQVHCARAAATRRASHRQPTRGWPKHLPRARYAAPNPDRLREGDQVRSRRRPAAGSREWSALKPCRYGGRRGAPHCYRDRRHTERQLGRPATRAMRSGPRHRLHLARHARTLCPRLW